MGKKFWVIVLTLIVFLSGALLGVSAVYRVELVTVEASLVSEEAKAEAEELKGRLEEAYDKANIFLANDEEAQNVAKEFPYFRITGFEKSYPNRLIVKIIENAEVYAVANASGDSYYILGEDGTVLDIRETPLNLLTGEENVFLEGISVTAEKGGALQGDEHAAPLLALAKEISAKLGGIRSNALSVGVFSRGPETIYRVVMREGVTLYFGEPSERTSEKVEAAMNAYLGLSDVQKLSGRIVVSEIGSNIFTSYSEKDEFKS